MADEIKKGVKGSTKAAVDALNKLVLSAADSAELQAKLALTHPKANSELKGGAFTKDAIDVPLQEEHKKNAQNASLLKDQAKTSFKIVETKPDVREGESELRNIREQGVPISTVQKELDRTITRQLDNHPKQVELAAKQKAQAEINQAPTQQHESPKLKMGRGRS